MIAILGLEYHDNSQVSSMLCTAVYHFVSSTCLLLDTWFLSRPIGTLSHSASTQNISHWPSVRAPVRLMLRESGCWSNEQTFIDIVAASRVRCLSQKDAFRKVERLNDTVSFEGDR